MHISLDVTANGKLPQPPYPEDSSNQIFNVTVFLFSYDTGRNFTVADGTRRPDADTRGVILNQEEGSTVKHVNWVWPDCLVGDGPPDEDDDDTDRGSYNVSRPGKVSIVRANGEQITIRQNFRLNDEDHYTILDVPIAVTNSIEASDERPSCDDLDNALLSPEEIDAQGANEVGVLFAPGDATEIDLADFDDAEGGGLELLVSKWQVVLAGLAGCAMVF